MAILNFFSWWYASGWSVFIKNGAKRAGILAENFSILTLLKTFFQPFRQLYADTQGQGVEGAFSAFVSRTVSRFVGAMARFFIILAGLICLLFYWIFFSIFIILWPLLPLTPIAGLIVSLCGVTL